MGTLLRPRTVALRRRNPFGQHALTSAPTLGKVRNACRLWLLLLNYLMSLPADYHMHTPLCRHAVGEPTELAAQAVKLGLKEIGFSDHSPMPRDDFDEWRMKASELSAYVAKVEQARRDHPGLTIKLALEVDYLPGG